MYTAHRKSSNSLKDFQSKNTRLKTLKTVTCLAAHTRIHTYVHTYIDIYIQQSQKKLASGTGNPGLSRTRPELVCCEAWWPCSNEEQRHRTGTSRSHVIEGLVN